MTEIPEDSIEQRLFTHLLTVLSVSSGMVGVCLTAIGLVGVVKSLNSMETVCDDLLAANAFLYLAVSLLSFVALRTPLRRRSASIALVVDTVFCLALALALTAVSCGLLVWLVL